MIAAPGIDFDEAHCFLNALGSGSHVFQVIPERQGCPVRAQVLEGSLDTHKAALASANRLGSGVFVTVNKAVGGRKKENIKSVRALFVDLDGAPIEPVLDAIPEPDIVVETSKGRYHAYWTVNDVPLDKFKLYQTTLIDKFDANPACTDLPRTMRLPGFFHNKREPFFTRIISIKESLVSYA